MEKHHNPSHILPCVISLHPLGWAGKFLHARSSWTGSLCLPAQMLRWRGRGKAVCLKLWNWEIFKGSCQCCCCLSQLFDPWHLVQLVTMCLGLVFYLWHAIRFLFAAVHCAVLAGCFLLRLHWQVGDCTCLETALVFRKGPSDKGLRQLGLILMYSVYGWEKLRVQHLVHCTI